MLAVREVSDGLGIETRVNEELASHVTGRAQFLSFYSLSLFSWPCVHSAVTSEIILATFLPYVYAAASLLCMAQW